MNESAKQFFEELETLMLKHEALVTCSGELSFHVAGEMFRLCHCGFGYEKEELETKLKVSQVSYHSFGSKNVIR